MLDMAPFTSFRVTSARPESPLVERRQRHQPSTRRDPRLKLQNPHRRRQPKATRPGAARVHHRHHLVHQREHRSVGMPEHDDLRPRKSRLHPFRSRRSELIAVGHDDLESIELDGGHLRQLGANVPAVGIAVDRGDRRDGTQLDEDLRQRIKQEELSSSIERAKISRDRVHLEQVRRELEKQIRQFNLDQPSKSKETDGEENQKSGGNRWGKLFGR